MIQEITDLSRLSIGFTFRDSCRMIKVVVHFAFISARLLLLFFFFFFASSKRVQLCYSGQCLHRLVWMAF